MSRHKHCREFSRDEVKKRVARSKNRDAEGPDNIVNEFVEHGGEGTRAGKTKTHKSGGEKE